MSISLFVNPLDSSSTWVVHVLESSIPFKGDGCRARHACLLVYASRSRLAWEMLGEDAAIVVLLLAQRRIDGETFCRMCHLFVADSFGGNLLQCVNP